MISVVIPTMWKYKPFVNYLSHLCDVDVIDEIIIINNDIKAMPIDVRLSHSKIKLINFDYNIYVNPAWNLGIELSCNDKICISNDDIMVDLKLFQRVDNFLTKDIGLIGLCPGSADLHQYPVTDGTINISPWSGEHTFGFGSFYFVHKENWNVIPDGLNIYYGDDWAFNTQLIMNRKNWIITNCFNHSSWATTTTKVGHGFLELERPIYNIALQNIANGTIALH